MIYQGAFPVGTTVRVASRAFLDDFKATWKYHNKLRRNSSHSQVNWPPWKKWDFITEETSYIA